MPPRSPAPTHHVPIQHRSRRTLDRIVAATEALLERTDFDAISVTDIVRRARTSVGSFYARFDGKEALLRYVYDRYHARLLGELGPMLEPMRWSQLELREVVERAVTTLVLLHRKHRTLLRAVALYARSSPAAVSSTMRAEREPLYVMAGGLFAAHRTSIRRKDPDEAISFALFAAASLCRERILFADAPHAAATPISDERLAREVTRLVLAYLTCADA
jgi:AcrR family transcriptional regulator